jgi:hypothetical protein
MATLFGEIAFAQFVGGQIRLIFELHQRSVQIGTISWKGLRERTSLRFKGNSHGISDGATHA